MSDVITRLTAALTDRYRVDRELGAGGMATVYLAHDLKHERDVAIKVLHPDLGAALGAERFLSEIKTTAKLQHPHILPLLDSGAANGLLYYVMPYVRGETLRTRLERERQLPIADALLIAREVADALHAAHALGIIHRDIKPENILLQDGHALVADFGIALAVQSAGGARMTQTGLSLGTPQYMSPEQAMGERTIDARSDIYALGAVTYEMLTGDAPFTGSSVQAIVAKVLTERPTPIRTTRDTVSEAVDHAVMTALAKLPADRFATAREFADALSGRSGSTTYIASSTAAHVPASRWKERLLLPLAVGFVVAVATAAWAWQRTAVSASAPPVLRTLLTLPDSTPVVQQDGSLFTISKDGSRFVYVGPGPGDRALWTRPWNALVATMIPATLGGDSPFLSPDGESVAFYLGGQNGLYTTSMRGGARQTIVLDSTVALGGDFGPDGAIYFSRVDGLRRIIAGSKKVEQVTTVNRSADESRHGWVDVLPNGKGAVFTIVYNGASIDAQRSQIAVVDFTSHVVTPLFRAVRAQYSPSGHLVYADASGGLFAIGFDQDKLVTKGSPLAIVPSGGANVRGVVDFTLSATGTLVYNAGNTRRVEVVVWVDRQGHEQGIDSTMTGPFSDLALSPDGARLAMTQEEDRGGSGIWIKDLGAAGTLNRLTVGGDNWGPAWTPDGSGVTYVHRAEKSRDLMRRRADGGDTAVTLLHTAREVDYGVIGPAADWIVYQASPARAKTGRDLFARRVTGDTSSIEIAATAAHDIAPQLSPDGRWIAYVSNASGTYEVFASPFPNVRDTRIQVSVDGGTHPLWSRDGRELFYVLPDGSMVAAALDEQPTLRIRDRVRLFDASSYNDDLFYGLTYDVAPDGKRFVMTRVKERGSVSLMLVQNWSAELPTAKQP